MLWPDRHPLIALSGKKRSGKDTFAARLIEAHGFTRIAFADPMRAAALALDPIIRIEQDETGPLIAAGAPLLARYVVTTLRLSEVVDAVGWETAKSVREVRRTLQRLGTEAGRQVLGEDVWVDAAMRQAEQVDGPVVITDCRFTNEADAVRARGGIVVRIVRDGLPAGDTHPSETALDDYPHFRALIGNNGTIDDLHAWADAVAELVTPRAA